MKTTILKDTELGQGWVEIDASGQILGKVATLAASLLIGKDKVAFTRHQDCGDFVIITNAAGVRVTGKKLLDKFWHRHSTHPGGLRSVSYADLLEKRPEKLVELAIKRMLPKNHLGRKMFTKLKVYSDDQHPHSAQQPKKVEVK
ncbi:MAG: 50S ribosomal protein L13 [Candidatus Lindowbacteria bacterium]|nr:50S ribosomal protein L13 [Candidatus Lindowbacteria bacterium]